MSYFRVFLVAAIAMGFAGSALAQGLYDVVGVASNDVLNVRASPNASSEKIGVLGPSDKNVEIVSISESGKWGLVNLEEQSGWVAMRFLKKLAILSEPPARLACSGTEPFWFLSFNEDRSAVGEWWPMGLVDGDAKSVYQSYWSDRPSNRTSETFGFRLENELTASGVSASGIIRQGICSDGMSERAYAYSIDMILSGPQNMLISGCCSVATE